MVFLCVYISYAHTGEWKLRLTGISTWIIEWISLGKGFVADEVILLTTTQRILTTNSVL